MKNHWHEQIQRYLNGQASAEEAAALQRALGEDVELRALYLDYMNLDVALAAAAEAATIADNDAADGIAPVPGSPAKSSPHTWRWLVAAAACAALATFAVFPRHRSPPRMRPDVAATCSPTLEAIAQLSIDPHSSIPAWASPTASMLDQPPIPQGGP
jgi:anti-sigma factor RsiW